MIFVRQTINAKLYDYFIANRDFRHVNTARTIEQSMPRSCVRVDILQNGVVTEPLAFQLRLKRDSGTVQVTDQPLLIKIQNTDGKSLFHKIICDH